LVGGFERERPGLAALALSADATTARLVLEPSVDAARQGVASFTGAARSRFRVGEGAADFDYAELAKLNWDAGTVAIFDRYHMKTRTGGGGLWIKPYRI
jgi:hypothetical protein